jgi:hypothetical protein
MGRMLALFLVFSALFAQAPPVLTNQNGTITGILRTPDGAPAVGVRVAALARPDAVIDLAAAASFAGLGETDSAGRYRLENIPPGRYYIVAGRVDAPTYYPGTVQPGEGTVVAMTPGLSVSAIDFVLNPGSVGRANITRANITNVSSVSSVSWVIPVQTRIEGGGKIPLFAAGRFPVVRFGAMVVALTGPSFTVALVGTPNLPLTAPEYRVTVENLPETYELRSLTFGATDLKINALRLPAANSGTIVTPSIVVALAVRPVSQQTGVRVSGQVRGDATRSIYISGNPGAIYADGTFEFIGVPHGRHNIVTLDGSGPGRLQGAALAVGDRDLANVELEEISVAPADSNLPALPAPVADRLPGSRSAVTSIRGRVIDGETGEPFNAGKVMINGDYGAGVSLNEDGRFEVPKLLPGKYVVEAVVFGIGTVSREVIVDEQDVAIELSVGN